MHSYVSISEKTMELTAGAVVSTKSQTDFEQF